MIGYIYLLLVCALILWVYDRIVHLKYYKLIKNFDSIGPSFPIIGHAYMFLTTSADDALQILYARAAKCKKTARFWRFSQLIIVVNTPQDIQTVLSSSHCLEKGSPYKAMGKSKGIVASHPSIWKPHRRLLNSPFDYKSILKKVQQVNKVSCQLVKDLEPYCNQGEISLHEIIGVRITDNILYNLIDHSFDKKSLEEINCLIDKIFDIMGRRVANVYTRYLFPNVEHFFNIMTDDVKVGYRLLAKLDNAFISGKNRYMPHIEEEAKHVSRKAQFRNNSDTFLKRIYRMAYYKYINELEVEETVTSIIMAGTDTTTRAIGNVILCLAMNSDVQDKLYRTLVETLGDEENINYDTISQVQYLDCVIKESLRFLTSVPLIIRRCNKKIQLEHGVVPAGTDIIISIDNIHKNEKIWGPNFNKFDPDHFLPQTVKRHPCSYIPFSYGPRNCLGYRYAQMTLKIMVAHLVRNYKFSTNLKPEDLIFKFAIIGKLHNNYMVSLTKRC